MLSLPLSDILNVAVVVSPAAVPGPSFNQALIVGPSTAIPSSERLRLYSSLEGMLEDTFTASSPEYLAAQKYFGQTPKPTFLWIGRQILSAIASATVHSGNAGTGYAVNDIVGVVQTGGIGGTLKVTGVDTSIKSAAVNAGNGGSGYAVDDVVAVHQSGGSGGTLRVASVDGSGAVTGLSIASAGTGYNVGTALGTTPNSGGGSGLKVDITSGVVTALSVVTGGSGYAAATGLQTTTTSVLGTGLEVDLTSDGLGETPLQAIQACRLAQPNWYACMFVGTAVDADHLAIAGFIEGASPAAVYFLTRGDAAVLNTPDANLLVSLKAQKYRRTFSLYATTQGGTYADNIYAAAAIMGKAMGMNTGAAGSYFDIMFKAIAGIPPEPLTQSQVNSICGPIDRSTPGMNANAMLSYANGSYTWVQPAIMASGDFFDEVLNLDMLASDMQYSGVNLLVSVPALPITDGGVAMMKNVLAAACDRAKSRGFIAPSGIWRGVNIGSGRAAIATGDALPTGFYLYADPVSKMSAQDRAARKMPPITCLLVEAQSGHSLSVTLDVQR